MENLTNCLDPAVWANLFAASADQPLGQCWDYGQAMAALGGQVRRYVWAGSIAQVLERRGLRLVNRGPLGGQAGPMLGRLARHWGALVATPEHSLSGFRHVPLITPRHHAIWRVDQGEPALRAGLSSKWRNHLARAEERGLRITQGGARALETLLQAEAAQRHARGYRSLPGAFATAWPGEKLLVEWREGGAMQAGMLFLRHGAWASYHCAWTSDRGRAVFAHGPMLMHAAGVLAGQGVTRIDLGPVDAEASPGLASFKKGTGAQVRALGATCWVLP